MDVQAPWTCTSVCTHHVLHVDEGVVDGHDLDALLEAGPQDQTADATEATAAHGSEHQSVTTFLSGQTRLTFAPFPPPFIF